MVVEIIRNIAEYAVYSEKFNKNFLDNLIEQNVFKAFASILSVNNRLINIQLIQTTSILLQNIKAVEKKCKWLARPSVRANPTACAFTRLHFVAPVPKHVDFV